MDNFDLKKFVSEKTLLNESAPGYDTRKFGESLPTMESVKAAYEAKNDIKEDVSKAKELADKVLTVASEGIKDLNGSELMEFRALIAQSFDMIDEANLNEEIPGSAMLKINQSVKSVSTAAKAMIDFYNQMAEKEQVDFLNNQKFKVVMDKLNALVKEKDENDEV